MGMAANKRGSEVGFRAVEILFNPWNTGRTTATVVTVDFVGARRIVHRIGSVSLRLGRSDLVGLAPSEVTELLVAHLHEWLLNDARERGYRDGATPQAVRPPAPPEGVTGAAWNPLVNVSLPGL